MRAIITALAAVVVAVGCEVFEASPDSDTLDELRNTVASIPIEVHDVMARWSANRVAYGYILNFKDGHPLGWIECADDGKRAPLADDIVVEVQRMLMCLNKNRTTSYKGCLDLILEDVGDENLGKTCSWRSFRHELRPENMPPATDPDDVTDDDITRQLLGDPPPLEIQLMLMGIPGFVGPKGALCVQAKQDWACAPDPFDGDHSPTTAASSGGGDR